MPFSKKNAAPAQELSETPESSLNCLTRILYRRLNLDTANLPKNDEEVLMWQCSLLFIKFRSSQEWKNVDAKHKSFLKSMIMSVERKYPLFGQRVKNLAITNGVAKGYSIISVLELGHIFRSKFSTEQFLPINVFNRMCDMIEAITNSHVKLKLMFIIEVYCYYYFK